MGNNTPKSAKQTYSEESRSHSGISFNFEPQNESNARYKQLDDDLDTPSGCCFFCKSRKDSSRTQKQASKASTSGMQPIGKMHGEQLDTGSNSTSFNAKS